MKSARDFENTTVDSNGWPQSDFGVVVWHGLARMDGAYALSFNGQASSVTGSWGGNGVSAISYNSGTNTSTATLMYTSTDGAGLYLTFTGTKRTASSASGTGVTNIKLMRPVSPGSTTSNPASSAFSSAFKNALSAFKAVRLMDFFAVNNNTGQTSWSDRMRPTYASFNRKSSTPGYGWEGIGGPWEYAALLANESGKDIWINIPVSVNDDYLLKIAQTFRYGSDGYNPYTSTQSNPVYPGLTGNQAIYIEYGNELWNYAGAFATSSAWVRDKGVSEAASTDALDYNGNPGDYSLAARYQIKRTVDISNYFRSVWGDSAMMTRIRPVLEWQQGNTGGSAAGHLGWAANWYNNEDGNHVSNPRPVSYYLWGGSGSTYYNPDNGSDGLNLTNIWTSDTYNKANWASPQARDASYAAAFGIRRTAYEGGPSMDNIGHSESVKAACWGDSRMKPLVEDHHRFWEQYGGDVFMYFTLGGDMNGGYYQWFMTDDLFNPPNGSPKYQAIQTLNGAAKDAPGFGASTGTTIDGNAFSLSSVDWQGPGTGAVTVASSGTDPNRRTSYNYKVASAGNYADTVNYNGTATIDVYVCGVLAGTVSTSDSGTWISAACALAKGVIAVRLVCKSGSASVSSVRLQ